MPFAPKRPKAPMAEETALCKLAAECSAAERCTADLLDKCAKWGLDAQTADRVVARLVKERFVDDARFAPAFVRDKARFSGWGPLKVRQALAQKRIDGNLMEDALAAFPKEEWDDILLRALKTKVRSCRHDDPQKRLASIVRFGLQRGYAYADVRRLLAQIDAARQESAMRDADCGDCFESDTFESDTFESDTFDSDSSDSFDDNFDI